MTLSAVLLGGGESSRMGTDKAEVMIEGEPLWRRQLRLLRQLELEEIFLSARKEPDWRPREIELVLDEPPSRGPMSGICAALARMEASHLLVLAVDMPFIAENDLRHLVSFARAGCGVVPTTDGRAEPLAAIYPKESLPAFTAVLPSSDRSLQPIVRQLAREGRIELVELSETETERYRSVNTPTDLSALPACS